MEPPVRGLRMDALAPGPLGQVHAPSIVTRTCVCSVSPSVTTAVTDPLKCTEELISQLEAYWSLALRTIVPPLLGMLVLEAPKESTTGRALQRNQGIAGSGDRGIRQ